MNEIRHRVQYRIGLRAVEIKVAADQAGGGLIGIRLRWWRGRYLVLFGRLTAVDRVADITREDYQVAAPESDGSVEVRQVQPAITACDQVEGGAVVIITVNRPAAAEAGVEIDAGPQIEQAQDIAQYIHDPDYIKCLDELTYFMDYLS